LLLFIGMFIRRCAWHRQYHGYGKFLGISSWRGWTITFSDGLCDGCGVRAREEWGLPGTPAPDHSEAVRHGWRSAFPYATVALAATIAGVAFGLVVEPPRNATGPPRPATVSGPTATEASKAAVADRIMRAAPHVAAHVPAPNGSASHKPSEKTAGASDGTRVVVGGSARARGGIVRVRDRRPVGVPARATEALLDVASAERIVLPREPAMPFRSAAPAIVEIQAP
jgi:hypothetical protein